MEELRLQVSLPRPAIRADRDEGLIRLTATKGPAALPPLLVDDAALPPWLTRPPGVRSNQ